jgi:hypothetical protein
VREQKRAPQGARKAEGNCAGKSKFKTDEDAAHCAANGESQPASPGAPDIFRRSRGLQAEHRKEDHETGDHETQTETQRTPQRFLKAEHQHDRSEGPAEKISAEQISNRNDFLRPSKENEPFHGDNKQSSRPETQRPAQRVPENQPDSFLKASHSLFLKFPR